MRLVFPDPTYDSRQELGKEHFMREIEAELSSLREHTEIRETDIGQGADWPAFQLLFVGLFFLGKPINENLEAWIAIAKKFAGLRRWITAKCGSQWIDEDAATLVAIAEICADLKSSPASIERIASDYVPIASGPLGDLDPARQALDGVFHLRFRVDGKMIFDFAIRSTGAIESKEKHNTR